MKGTYKLRTPLPRYDVTWDPAVVLDFLSNGYPNVILAYNLLTKKPTTLFALTTAYRAQTLSLIRLHNIQQVHNEKFVIKISDPIKTSALGKSQPLLTLPYFDEIPSVCPAKTLEQYLKVTSSMRPAKL